MTSNSTRSGPSPRPALPDVRRADAAVAVIDTITVWDDARQREVADALLAADRPWHAGLLSDTVLLGADGITVLRYSQWTGEQALDGAPEHEAAETTNSVRHRLYRSAVPGDPTTPGIIVVVTFDTADAGTARGFVDALLDRHPATTGAPYPTGMGGNHFHVALDGTQMLNWAEFADEESHQRVVEERLKADDEVPRLVAETPGLTGRGFLRYRPYGTATREGTARW
ncbi:antibiotic biosynthesis monooxygenase [Saccharomonospora xinjiangensis]|uniref:antibiotic biosynthesis monooxygenase n=1 Tax=Saccharomonospora xinjiangensis TaxID=75294 RepID=UPI00106F6C23|nr:antibiotic biosynthesis monooxygenase [Saccharomonospora xinjiangensis]QBQ59996.1 hypothetical protein EYD13_08175 [Saccharomonospora xinjiangensis]